MLQLWERIVEVTLLCGVCKRKGPLQGSTKPCGSRVFAEIAHFSRCGSAAIPDEDLIAMGP